MFMSVFCFRIFIKYFLFHTSFITILFSVISLTAAQINPEIPKVGEKAPFDFAYNGLLQDAYDVTILSELDIITTWDGRRNTLIANDIFSINPSMGLEFGYKKIAFLRFGFGNFQKEIMINDTEQMKFQPNFGIGIDVWSFVLDYSLTDLGNNSSVLYSNIFTLKYKF